jgi:L-seryl-tRNA(Ser) seleniumtransferase
VVGVDARPEEVFVINNIDAGWGDVYKELGAKPVVNAIGSVTMLGGSTPPAEVREAMERANDAYVPLMELQDKAGAAIAAMTGVPAAYITAGAGSALTLATAAVMAGTDDDRIQQLPDTTGMKNEILIQTRQRYWYDRCLELAGARLVEFGDQERTTAEQLETAIGPKTAAVHYFAVEQSPDPDALSLEATIEVAHSHGVPVLVDAAGQIYPLDNIGKYVRMGADFQCVAAKYIGAPHSTGYALGTDEMISALALQSFASYEGRMVRGIGRPQKVDRQEMVGAVAAIRRWMTMNHEDRLSEAERRSLKMVERLQGISGVTVTALDNVVGHQAFGLRLEFDADITGMTADDVVAELKKSDPPVFTRTRAGEDYITIHVFGLRDGEEVLVGDRIAALFVQ